MKKFLPLTALLLCAACAPASSSTSSESSSTSTSASVSSLSFLPTEQDTLTDSATGQSVVLTDEVATTPDEQQQGLMGRTSLAPNAGMLFVFDEEQALNFWMKDTLIPLDIIFFAQDGSYVSSTTMQPCVADPCQIFPSGEPAMFALELPSGTIAAHNIGSTWKLSRSAQ